MRIGSHFYDVKLNKMGVDTKMRQLHIEVATRDAGGLCTVCSYKKTQKLL